MEKSLRKHLATIFQRLIGNRWLYDEWVGKGSNKSLRCAGIGRDHHIINYMNFISDSNKCASISKEFISKSPHPVISHFTFEANSLDSGLYKMADEQRKQHVNLGQTSQSIVDVGALGFPQLSSCPKSTAPPRPPFPRQTHFHASLPMLPPPHSQKSRQRPWRWGLQRATSCGEQETIWHGD